MRKKVLIIQPIHAAGMAILQAREDIEVEVTSDFSEEALKRTVCDAHGITARTARITKSVVDAAEVLEVVSRHGVGYDRVDVSALTARGIPLTLAIDANATSVAEHTLFLILSLAKAGFAHDRATRAGDWNLRASVLATDIGGKSLLIVGFGRIGRQVAPRALTFGMKVYAYDPYVDDALMEAAGCIAVSDLAAALPNMSAVTLHCPLSAETTGLIGEAEFRAMKSSAFLINTARGGIVDESALHHALATGEIAGAGLDVLATEPAPTDSPLFGLDNVVVSPHVAGVTSESSVRMATSAARNVLAAFDGTLNPDVVVNKEVLTRKFSKRKLQ